MFSIPKSCDNMFDVMVYTIAAMKESDLSDEIDDYISDAISESNWHLIEASNERLEDCNKAIKTNKQDWYEDSWRDHYYSNLWNESSDLDSLPNEEYDLYDCVTSPGIRRYYWEDEAIDEDAYEGFESCKNHYWDCSEEDDDDSNWKIKGYYDSMMHEFDPSYDEHYGDDLDSESD